MADTGLRGKVEDYKAYILSLLFFKRLSDNYEWETENRVREFGDQFGSEPSEKQLERMRAEGHDFIIPEGCFWKDVRSAETSEKNDKLNACVQAIAEQNKPLKGIINSVRWNEPAPDGSGNKRIEPEVLIAAMNVLDHVPLDNPSIGSGPGDVGQVEALFRRDLAGIGRSEQAVTGGLGRAGGGECVALGNAAIPSGAFDGRQVELVLLGDAADGRRWGE